jgi:hypothetical protein
MKLFYSLLTLGIALQITAWIFWVFNVCPYITYPLGNAQALEETFSIDLFDLMFTGTGLVVIGLAGLLLRQGTYAIYAMVIWAIGTIIPFIRNTFLAIPNTIGGLLNLVTSSYADAETYVYVLTTAFSIIFAYAAFWWLFNLVIQRDVTPG